MNSLYMLFVATIWRGISAFIPAKQAEVVEHARTLMEDA